MEVKMMISGLRGVLVALLLALVAVVAATAATPSPPQRTSVAPPSLATPSEPLPTATTVTPSIDIPDVGDEIWINATTSTGGVTYSWTWLPPGCTSANALDIACRVTGVGGTTYHPTIWFTGGLFNASGGSATTTLTVEDVVAGTLAQSGSGTIEVGGSVTYTVTPSGGTGVYRVSYSGLPGGCLSSNTTSLTCAPTSASTSQVAAAVKDSLLPPGNPEPAVNNASTVKVTTLVLPAPTVMASASPTATDAGFAVQFNATTTGGLGAYGFSWRYADGTSGLGRNPVHAYQSPGTYLAIVYFNDSEVSVWSTVSVIVHGDVALSASANPSDLILGTSVVFQAGLSGGTGASLAWRFGDGPETSSYASPTHLYNSTGTFTAGVWANDSVGGRVFSSTSVTVAPPVANHVVANTSTPDVGSPVQFTGSASGGFPGYTWNWRFGIGGSSSSLQDPVFSFASGGVYVVTLWSNDTLGDWNSTSISIDVFGDPLVVAASATPDPADVGTLVDFTATTSGGGPTGWVNWTFADGSLGYGASPTQTFPAAGTYIVRVWFNDSSHLSNESSVVVTINPPVTAVAGAAPATTDLGTPTAFNGTETGGTWSYRYAWTFGAAGGTSSHENPVFTYPAPGRYAATLWVNDSVGGTSFAQVIIVVNPVVSATARANPTPVDAGTDVFFNSTESGGTWSFHYAWTFGAGGGSSHLQNPIFAYPSSGTFTATLWVNDSAGGSAVAHVQVTVDPPLDLSATLTPLHGVAPLQVQGTASATGGTGGVSFEWNFGDRGTSAQASPTHTYTAAGTYAVSVFANDSLGDSQEQTFSVVVALPLSLEGVSVDPNGSHPGTSVAVSVSTNGGIAPLAYSWELNGSTFGATGPTFAFTPHGAGNFSFSVTVQDSVGEQVHGRETLEVVANGSKSSPPPLAVGFEVSSKTVPTGENFWLNATVAGGTAPYTYEFYQNSSSASAFEEVAACLPSSPSCVLSQSSAGNYTYYVLVQDAAGRSATSAQRTIEVTGSVSSSPGTSPKAVITTQELTAIAVVSLVLLAVLALLLVLARRRKRTSSSPTTDTESPVPGAPSSQGSVEDLATGGVLLAGPEVPPGPPPPLATAVNPPPPPSPASPDPLEATAAGTSAATATPTPLSSSWDESPAADEPSAAFEEEAPTEATGAASPAAVAEVGAPVAAAGAPPATAGSEPWTRTSLTFVETRDAKLFWDLVARGGVAKDHLLLLVDESPQELGGLFDAQGATVRWINRKEGEDRLAPGDVDRMGFLMDQHYETGSGRAVVLTGIDRIVSSVGVRNTARLIDHARDQARAAQGALLVHVDPSLVPVPTRKQIGERAQIVRLMASKRSKDSKG